MIQHPTRPWWSRASGPFSDTQPRWVRTDGIEVMQATYGANARPIPRPVEEVDADLEYIDRQNPLPVPEPACGQVWRTTIERFGDVHTVESMVFVVDRDAEGRPHEARMSGTFHGSFGPDASGRWPPNGHQGNPGTLIAGPAAPWWPESRS